MKIWYAGLLALLLVPPAMADGSQPADGSIRELLAVMQSKKMLDGAMEQVNTMIQASMKQALAGKQASPAQQKVMDDMRVKMIDIFKQEMTWDVLESMFIDVYKKSFTQEDVDGMLAFYKSPPGQAVVAKMPFVMQYTVQAMQTRMAAMMPKIQELQRDAIAQLKSGEHE